MNCEFQILAENENGYIGQCPGCCEFNFAYKNILITFSENHLLGFGNWLLANRSNPEYYFQLPHGRSRIYASPLPNLFLAFDEPELNDLSQLFAEVELVLEARRIVGYL